MRITDFSNNYSALRNLALGAMALLLVSHIAWAVLYVQAQYAQQAQVYVVSEQGTFVATHQASAQREAVEVIDHIEKFTHYMFTHDANSYETHLEKALHLINRQEGMIIQSGFEKDGLLDLYIRQGARWESLIDTIIVDQTSPSIHGRVYWQQRTLMGDQQQDLPVAARFELSIWPRAEQNRNGLMINAWHYIPYQPTIQSR